MSDLLELKISLEGKWIAFEKAWISNDFSPYYAACIHWQTMENIFPILGQSMTNFTEGGEFLIFLLRPTRGVATWEVLGCHTPPNCAKE